MRYLILLVFTGFFAGHLGAQSHGSTTGKISYISSQNVYVKFESTKNIQTGDTLYMKIENTMVPVLKVENLSSTSCVCKPVSDIELSVSMNIIALIIT
jgi:hypothetical protein